MQKLLTGEGKSMSLTTPKKGYKSVPWLFGKEI